MKNNTQTLILATMLLFPIFLSAQPIVVDNKGTVKSSVIGNKNEINKTQTDTVIGTITDDKNDIVQFETEGKRVQAEIGGRININTLVVGSNNTVNITKVFYSIGKSVEYADLKKDITDLENRYSTKNKEYKEADSPKWKEKATTELGQLSDEIEKKTKRLENFVRDVIGLAESFSRIEINSERLSKAKAFFEQGKFREADAILKTEDMRSDGEKLLTRAAQLTSEMQKNDNGLLIVSTEFLIKAQLTTINYTIKSQFDSAKTYFRQSLRYFETPENLIAFADFYRENHIYDSAIQLYSRLITRPKAEAWQKANAYSHLGELYTTQGYLNEELKAYTIFFEIYDSLSKRDTLSSFYKINLAVSYQKLGSLHNSLDDFDNALFFHHKGIKLFEELNITYPANVDFKSKLANSYLELGDVNAKLKCNNIALYFYDKGIKLFEELNVFYPTNVDFKNNVAVSCGKLGNTQMKLDSLDKALVYFEKNLEILIELYNAYPNKVDYKYNLAIAYLQLGNMGIPLKNLEKEMRFYDKGIKLFEELNISYPTNVWFKNGLAITLAKLGRCCQKQNKNANQAKIYFQKAEKLWLALIKDASQYADFKKSLEIVQQDLKDLDTGKN